MAEAAQSNRVGMIAKVGFLSWALQQHRAKETCGKSLGIPLQYELQCLSKTQISVHYNVPLQLFEVHVEMPESVLRPFEAQGLHHRLVQPMVSQTRLGLGWFVS